MIKELKFDSQGLLKIMEVLRNDQVRLVGGCVRDALLGKEINDFDIATALPPSKAQSLFEKNNMKVIPTGLKHGTITVMLDSEKFEVTTLRKDLNCDGRWAEVEFTKDFKEDASRRDFTINALSYDIFTGEVFDYFNGLKHLEDKQVIFIGNPQQRIIEDHLRIMRFFRFSTYYSDVFDLEGLQVSKDHARLLQKISQERINSEFDKILQAPKQERIVATLLQMQQEIFPNIFPSFKLTTQILQQVLDLAQDWQVALELDDLYASLFCLNEPEAVFTKLKFSTARIKNIKHGIRFFIKANKTNIIDSLYKEWINGKPVGAYTLIACALDYLSEERAKELSYLFQNTSRPIFPIDGDDIERLGYSGKEIGNMLNYLKEIWIQSNFKLSKIELMECLLRKL